MRTMLRPFIPRVLRLCINKNSDFIKAITEKYVILSSEDFPAVDLIYFLGENEQESYDKIPDFLVTRNISENTLNEEIKQIAINRYYLNTNILYQIYSYRDGNVTVNRNISKNEYYSRSSHSTADYLNKRAAYHRRLLQNNIMKYTVPDYQSIWNISVNQPHPEEADMLLSFIDNIEEAEKKVMIELLGLTRDNYRQTLQEIKSIRFEEIKKASLERALRYERLEPAARLISEYINRGKKKNRYSQKSLTKVILDIHTGRIKPEKILQTVYDKSTNPVVNPNNTDLSTITELSEHNEGFSFFINHGIEAADAAKRLAEALVINNRSEAVSDRTEREKEGNVSHAYISQNSFNDAVSVFVDRTGGSIESYLKLTQMERMQLKTDFLSLIERKESTSFVKEIIRDILNEEALQEEAKGWISFPEAEKEYLKESESSTAEKNTERVTYVKEEMVPLNNNAKSADIVQHLSQWVQYMTQETWDNTVRLIFRNSQNIKMRNSIQSVSTTQNTPGSFSYSGYLRDVFHLIESSANTISEQHYTETKQEKKALSFDITGPVFIDKFEYNAETVFPYQYPDMVITYPGAVAGTHISPAATGEILKKTEAAIQSVREEATDITKIRRNMTESSTDAFEETVRKLTEQVDQQHKDIKRMEENQNLIIRNTDTTLLTERVLRNLNRQVYLEKLRKGIR